MSLISFHSKGDFSKTRNFFKKTQKLSTYEILDIFGRIGVDALKDATPKDTGETAASWFYELEEGPGFARIQWSNSNVEDGYFNVAVFIQYGHGTGTGGYVEGIDYINPALKPIFDKIADDAFKKINSL